MRLVTPSTRRAGSILPLVAISLVALLGFVALAIDVGILMIGRTECQNAADAAAMAGARTLNGDVPSNNNFAAAGPKIVSSATQCSVLTVAIPTGSVAHEIGYYTYNRTNNTFGAILPSSGGTMPVGENWSLAKVTITSTNNSAFAKVFGVASLNSSATAVAVHRPRDITIIMDYSGSMSFDSLLGGDYTGSRTASLNGDSIYPQFGHYSGYNSQATAPIILASGEALGLANTVVDTNAGSAIVNDFYKNDLGAAPQLAFSPANNSYATAPGGDKPLRKDNNTLTSAYAISVADVLGSTTINASFESLGYSAPILNSGGSPAFEGYTMGPRYWGKTFFIWPPDPRSQHDWRRKFFFKADNTTPLDDNTALWTAGTSPTAKSPRTSSVTNFYINYAAILRWLTTTGTNPFPTQLRAGRIRYYSAIPDVSNTANDAALNTRFRSTNPTDLNERFWKHYIDFVLGFEQTGAGPVYDIITPNVGYGDAFNWGTKNISAKPTSPDLRYMNYSDNPGRPKLRFWFGPMTMIDFIDNFNQNRRWMPGTAHQAPLWGCKIGMRSAIRDIQNNHPNNYVALSYFSSPEYAANDGGKHNRIKAPLGRSYQRMIDSLFYPQVTIDDPANYPEIHPYDTANMRAAPRADGGTCAVMGFMQAFNQFSSNPSLVTYNPSPAPPGDAGGLGRVGAQKMIIFMTDGVANAVASANFTNSGAYQSYYRIRIPGEYPTNTGTVESQLYAVANQICALDTANPPGYSTARKPVLIHSIAFGSLFDPSVTSGASASRDLALSILQKVQHIGKTQPTQTTPLPTYKIITGTADQRVILMQECFKKIMQDAGSVTLIE